MIVVPYRPSFLSLSSHLQQFLPHLLPFAPHVLGPLNRLSSSVQHAVSTSALLITNDPPPDYHSLSKPPTIIPDGTSSTPEPIFDADLPFEPSSSSSKALSQLPTGPYASLPLSTCPICYRNQTHSDSLSSAPPIPQLPSIPALVAHPPMLNELASLPDFAEVIEDDPNAVHVPVKADCWGECVYCYFCLGEMVVREEARERERRKSGRREKAKGWECLRCGGEAWGFQRVVGVRGMETDVAAGVEGAEKK